MDPAQVPWEDVPELPTEMWDLVADYLPVADQAHLMQVSQEFRDRFAGIYPARTRAELNVALAAADARLIVLMPGDEELTVAAAPASPRAHIVAERDANVLMAGVHVGANVSIKVSGGAWVRAFGSARVVATDRARVFVKDAVRVTASGGAYVEARGEAQVEASGDAEVLCYNSVNVTATGNARVRAYSQSGGTVTASDNTWVRAAFAVQVNGSGPGVRVWALPGTSVNNPAGVYWWEEAAGLDQARWGELADEWDAWKAREQAREEEQAREREPDPSPDHDGRPDAPRDSSSDEDDHRNPMDQVD